MTETVHLAVYDTLADWETGFATAHINSGSWHKTPGRYQVRTVGATAEPVTTESLRFGQRVKVMAVSVPPIMRTPEALDAFGPRAFGFERDFVPLEALMAE